MGLTEKNIRKSFKEFDLEKVFAPEGSRRQTKRGEWYVKQGGKWIYEKKGKKPSSEKSTQERPERKYGIHALRELDFQDFNNYGMIGFDKMSRYKPGAQAKAHKIMKEGIQLRWVKEHDYGRGKGKYSTTDAGDEVGSLSGVIKNIYDNKPILKEQVSSTFNREGEKTKVYIPSKEDDKTAEGY